MKRQRTLALSLAFGALLLFAAPASAETWNLDPAHSAILFRVKHVGVSYTWGRFRKFSGQIETAKKASKSSVELTINAGSVYTNWKRRDTHLMSPDFFNVKLYPLITFKSSRVKKRGNTWIVSGTLAMHGKEKKITLRMKQVGKGKGPYGKMRIGFSGRTTVKRSDFGITKFVKEKVAGDKVELFLDIEAIKVK